MDGYKSLPFAMYDLAVYLPGGAVFIYLLKIFADNLIFSGPMMLPHASSNGVIDSIILAVIWISSSYLVGHLASFISTYAVEKFVHNHLGFPSEIWLKREKLSAQIGTDAQKIKQIFRERLENWPSGWVAILIIIIQLPAIVPIFAMIILKPFGFYSPKLPIGLSKQVSERLKIINDSIELENGSRWEKMVEHFVANKCQVAYTRLYNYLVIYGALRLLSLSILFICWTAILISIKNLVIYDVKFDVFKFSIISLLPFLYVLSVMAFAKFNRRFFEEAILAFVIAPLKSFQEINS